MKRLQTWPWQRALTLGLTLRARIVFGTLLPVFAIATYFFCDLQTQRRLAETTHDILDRRMVSMHSAERIKEALVAYDDALFRYLAVQDPDPLRDEEHWKKETQDHLTQLRHLASSPLILERLSVLQRESDQYFIDAEELQDYARKTRMPARHLNELSSSWSRDRARRTGIILGVLATGVLALLAIGFTLSLLSALRSLMQGIRRMEEGDLKIEIPVITDDEVGELTCAFNRATRLICEQREQLLHETITDGLTGAYNQRHFRTILRQEVERAHRGGSPVSLLMIDVDRFKEYNDTYGHEFGNEVLKTVSALIRETIRDIDILARYGGDEFAVILPQANAEQADVLAHRILEGAASQGALKSRGDPSIPKLTLSIGGASYPNDGPSAEAIIHRADDALYQAKEAGRGRLQWAAQGNSGSHALEVAPH